MIEHRLIERMIDVMKEEGEFDKSLIHEKYRNMVMAAEKILTAKKL
jgi:septum formation inhibitor-activating ATPase MinD